MDRLKVKIGDLELKNPVMTASGTFGYGTEFVDFMDLGAIGGIFVKGTTLEVVVAKKPEKKEEGPTIIKPAAPSEDEENSTEEGSSVEEKVEE